MLIIDESTSRELLDMDEAIPVLEQSFRALSLGPTLGFRGDVEDPDRSTKGILIGSYVGPLDAVCFKVVGTWQGHRNGLIVVFDTATGRPEALVSAGHVTDIRTGAASAVATRILARPGSSRLAILGTGRQALTQLQAMLAVLPIQQVTVWNRTAANGEAWIGRAHALLGPAAPSLELAGSAEEAVQDADVVITCTRAETPVLQGRWLRPGTHVNAVGAGHPGQRELELSVLQRVGVKAVDSRDLALRTGDFAGPLASGDVRADEIAELGEVLLGRRSGRAGDDQVTLFKSVGHAANDLAVARMLAKKARALGKGVWVEM